VTKYVYGSTLSESKIARADLLRAEIYPDSDDTTSPLGNGADGIYDRVEYKYNRQGERIREKGPERHRPCVRLRHPGSPDSGPGDDACRWDRRSGLRITTSYEVAWHGREGHELPHERAQSSSSSSSSSGSDVVNEVKFVYNNFSQLVDRLPGARRAVNTSTSVNVQFGYADGSLGTIRPTSSTYPNGRVLNFNYGSSGGTSDALNRVGALVDNDGSTHLADYFYLGLGGFVQVDCTGPSIRLRPATGRGQRSLRWLGQL